MKSQLFTYGGARIIGTLTPRQVWYVQPQE